MSTTALVSELPRSRGPAGGVGPGSGSPLPLVQIRHMGGALGTAYAGRRCAGDPARRVLRVRPRGRRRRAVGGAGGGATSAPWTGRSDPYRVGEYPNFVEHPAEPSRLFDPRRGTDCARSRRSTTRTSCSGATTTSRRPRLRPSRRADGGLSGAVGCRTQLGWVRQSAVCRSTYWKLLPGRRARSDILLDQSSHESSSGHEPPHHLPVDSAEVRVDILRANDERARGPHRLRRAVLPLLLLRTRQAVPALQRDRPDSSAEKVWTPSRRQLSSGPSSSRTWPTRRPSCSTPTC